MVPKPDLLEDEGFGCHCSGWYFSLEGVGSFRGDTLGAAEMTHLPTSAGLILSIPICFSYSHDANWLVSSFYMNRTAFITSA